MATVTAIESYAGGFFSLWLKSNQILNSVISVKKFWKKVKNKKIQISKT